MKFAPFLFGAAAGFLFGCPPGPVPPPVDADAMPAPPSFDGGVVEAFGAACANLTRIGCADGADGGPACLAALEKNAAMRLTTIDVACATSAATQDAARACAGIVCR